MENKKAIEVTTAKMGRADVFQASRIELKTEVFSRMCCSRFWMLKESL